MASSHLFKNASQFHISGPNFVINANTDPVSGSHGTSMPTVGATTPSTLNDPSPPEFFTNIRPHPDGETYASHEIYVYSLLVKKNGLPVWRPDPQGSHFPPEYNASGVQIGDVGFVAIDGSFEYVFNITLPFDHPVNRGRTPPGFIPISFSDSLTRTQSTATVSASFDGLTSRCRTVEEKHKPGAVISHPKIRRDSTNLQDNAGLGYKIITSAPRGAILVVPEGGLSKDLNNYRDFLSYAQQNAISWYKYINETLGRQISNGALYLVTGYDKSNCWGVAAFSNPDREEIIMRFQQNPATVQAEDQGSENSSLGSNGRRWWSPIWSSLMSSGTGSQAQQRQSRNFKWSEKYYWIEDSVIDTSTRSGPDSLAVRMPVADADTGGVPEPVRNQCLFIRGYRISLGEKPTNPFASVVVNAKDVGDLEPEDLMRSRMGGYVPFGLNTSFSNGSRSAYSNTRHDGTVLASHVPELENSNMIHPSNDINDFLLKTDNDLEVALTHDEEWMSLLEETDQNLPDRDTLLARLPLKFRVVSENRRAHLENIDNTAAGSDAPVTKSRSPIFFISTSASFMFDGPPEYPDMEDDLTVEDYDEDDSPPVDMPSLTLPIFKLRLRRSDFILNMADISMESNASSKRLREKSAHTLEHEEKRGLVTVSRYEDIPHLAEESYSEKLLIHEETRGPMRKAGRPPGMRVAPEPEETSDPHEATTKSMPITEMTPVEHYDQPLIPYPALSQISQPDFEAEPSSSSIASTSSPQYKPSILAALSLSPSSFNLSRHGILPRRLRLARTLFERDRTQSTIRTTLPLGLPEELVSVDQSDYTESWLDDDESTSWTSVIPLMLVEATDLEERYLDDIRNMAAAESSSQELDSLPSLSPGVPQTPQLPSQFRIPYQLMQELQPLPVDSGSIIPEQRPSWGTSSIQEPSMGTAPRESTIFSTVTPVTVEETSSTLSPGSGPTNFSSPIWSAAEEEKRAVRKPMPEVPKPRNANLPQDVVSDLQPNVLQHEDQLRSVAAGAPISLESDTATSSHQEDVQPTLSAEFSHRTSESELSELSELSEARRRSIREGKKPARDEHGSETTQSHTHTMPAGTVDVRRPPPNRATLQHLCTFKNENGILGVAVTHRYREKYVSTIYYKSVD